MARGETSPPSAIVSKNDGAKGVWPPSTRSSCPPSSIQTDGRSASSARAPIDIDATIVAADTLASRRQRRSVRLCLVLVNSLIGSPLPILRDADADQLGIGEKDVGRQSRVVAVQERSGDGRFVEDIFVVEHHLPTVLVGEDQGQIDIGVSAQAIVWIVVEHARPGIVLPVIVAA